MSEKQRGENNPMYGRRGELNPLYKKKKSKEHRLKLSNSLKEKFKNDKEYRQKVLDSQKKIIRTGKNNNMSKQVIVYHNSILFGEFDSIIEATKEIEKWFLENKNIKCSLYCGIQGLARGEKVTKRSKLYGWTVEEVK